jgi:hypothetical protein
VVVSARCAPSGAGRYPPAGGQRAILLDGADEWFDPERIGPDERWEIALPDVSRVKQYAAQVLDGLLRRIALLPTTTTPRCTRSAARCTTRTCRGDHRGIVAGIGRSAGRAGVRGPAASVSHNDALHFPGGNFTQGWSDADGFAWPDELPPQKVYVPAFEMDAALVSNAQFLEFVEDGGYEHPAYWSAAGRQWLMTQERSAPRYWSRHAVTRSWVVSRFGAERTLNPDEPVRHVTLFEAQAWCVWAVAACRRKSNGNWRPRRIADSSGARCASGPPRHTSRTWASARSRRTARSSAASAPIRWCEACRLRACATAPYARANALLPEDDVSFVGFRTCAV